MPSGLSSSPGGTGPAGERLISKTSLDRGAGRPGPELAQLRDGSEVLIRPIEPGDAQKLLSGFRALSPDSRYRRFLAPTSTLDSRWLKYLTDVDHHDHEALIAEASGSGEPVGVARFIRTAANSAVAEVAVTVVDHWQGKGVASALLTLLSSRAREEGITRYRATCLAENRVMLGLLRDLGDEHSAHTEAGVVEIEIDLPDAIERGNPLHAALVHASSGTLEFTHPRPAQSPLGARPAASRGRC